MSRRAMRVGRKRKPVEGSDLVCRGGINVNLPITADVFHAPLLPPVGEDERSQLGFGEYYSTNYPSVLNWRAQTLFFESLDDLVPAARRILLADVWPHFVKAGIRANTTWTACEAMIDASSAVRRFRDRLLGWADRFRIRRPWALDAALSTLWSQVVLFDFAEVIAPEIRQMNVHFLKGRIAAVLDWERSGSRGIEERWRAFLDYPPPQWHHLFGALRKWATKHGFQPLLLHPLRGRRLLFRAADLAHGFSSIPESGWLIPGRPMLLNNTGIFDFSTQAWEPEAESLALFCERTISAFEIAFEAHIEERTRAAKKAGLVQTPEALPRQRIKWLVQFQVMEQEAHQIAKAVEVDWAANQKSQPKLVLRGIDEAAEWVDGPQWKEWRRSGLRGNPSWRKPR